MYCIAECAVTINHGILMPFNLIHRVFDINNRAKFNAFISPDLFPKEREAAKKLRTELSRFKFWVNKIL